MRDNNILLEGYRSPYTKSVGTVEYITIVVTWHPTVSATEILVTSPLASPSRWEASSGGKQPSRDPRSTCSANRTNGMRNIATSKGNWHREFASVPKFSFPPQINRHGARVSGRRGLPKVTILRGLQEEANRNSQQDPECATRPTRVPGHGTENRG